jgi:hypothetical protein
MPSRYSRFGQIFSRALQARFSEMGEVAVPSIGTCRVENVLDPYIHNGAWSFTFDLQFPNSYSSMTFGVFTFGSCLLGDTEGLQLPEVDFEDPTDTEFPKEHQDAWFNLLDALREGLKERGLKDSAADDWDFHLVDDYYPSRGVSGTLHKPQAVTADLALWCQSLLRQHGGWRFWIQFDLGFSRPEYMGRDERLLIREDRIVLDMNLARLRTEFPNEFLWEAEGAL